MERELLKSPTERVRLIKMVSENRCIWNKNELGATKSAKIEAWQTIANSFNISSKAARSVWENLRDQYRREVQKERNGITTMWRYYKEMEFLRPFIRQRSSKQDSPSTSLSLTSGSRSPSCDNMVWQMNLPATTKLTLITANKAESVTNNSDNNNFEVTEPDFKRAKTIHTTTTTNNAAAANVGTLGTNDKFPVMIINSFSKIDCTNAFTLEEEKLINAEFERNHMSLRVDSETDSNMDADTEYKCDTEKFNTVPRPLIENMSETSQSAVVDYSTKIESVTPNQKRKLDEDAFLTFMLNDEHSNLEETKIMQPKAKTFKSNSKTLQEKTVNQSSQTDVQLDPFMKFKSGGRTSIETQTENEVKSEISEKTNNEEIFESLMVFYKGIKPNIRELNHDQLLELKHQITSFLLSVKKRENGVSNYDYKK